MPKELGLILRALRAHRVISALIALQIALACAILANGLSLVSQRYNLQTLSSGLPGEQLVVLEAEALQGPLQQHDLSRLLGILEQQVGTDSAAAVNTLPFSHRASTYGFSVPGSPNRSLDASLYYGSPGFMEVLGVEVLSGRGFAREDFSKPRPNPLGQTSTVILSESLARRMSLRVGSRIEVAGQGLTVIGISTDVQQPAVADPAQAHYSAFVASHPDPAVGSLIVVNTGAPPSPNAVNDLVATVTEVTPQTFIWSANTLSKIRADYFRLDRAVMRLVLLLGLVLALVVAAGIGGLSSAWIVRRHKQIAIRRSLGARRRDVAWYFHVENLIVTATGAVAGLLMALAVNLVLGQWMALPAVPLPYLLTGGLLMVAVGQLAVFVPVRRALAIPPAAVSS